MKKKKNIFKTLGLFASACLVCSGGIFLGSLSQKEEFISNNVSAYAELPQSSTAFLSTENITNSYIFINEHETEKSSYARLFFNTAAETDTTATPMSFKGTYFNGTEYLGFNISSIKITLNGQLIDTSYDTVQPIVDIDETYPFVPQTFDMYFTINNSAEKSYFLTDGTEKTNVLALCEQGVVSVTIDYTEYVNVAYQSNATTYVLENEEVKTAQSLTYSFLVLDKNEYLVPGNDDAPNADASEDFIQTASKILNYDYNLFSSYSTENVPSITYNPYDYELNFSCTDKEKITKYYKISYNHANDSYKVLDFEGNEVPSPVGLQQVSKKELKLYFYDLGEYSLNYNGIYVNSNDVYKINKDFKGQKVYVYGYQNFFTISSGNYEELKTYDENHTSYTLSSDKTFRTTTYLETLGKTLSETDTEEKDELFTNINEVSTNRRPIKFKSIEGVTISSDSGFYYRQNNLSTWSKEKQSFAVGNDFTDAGQYIVYLKYGFSNFTDAFGDEKPSETFEQYFIFEIANNSIEFNTYTKDKSNNKTELPNRKYTNQDTFISYDQYDNNYSKKVSFYIVKYDYENKTYFSNDKSVSIYIEDDDIPSLPTPNNIYPAELVDWTKNGANYTISENGEIKITENGNYGIYAFREDLESPASRLFNIDKITNFNLASYTVEQSSATFNYYATKEVEGILSNEPLLFSWDTRKASGAETYGSFKRYLFSDKALYDSNFFKDIHYYLSNNIIPVEYQLNITETTWRSYTNFDYKTNPKKAVDSTYMRRDAGLYVFQTHDEAGNTQTKIYIIDNTAPVFFTYNEQTKDYSLLSGYDTLSVDSQIIWGKYKAISLNTQNLDTAELYKGRTETYDFYIEEAFKEVLSKPELVDAHDNANICYLSLPNSSSPYTGYYLVVDINDNVYFKNYFETENDYKFIQGSLCNYSFDIVSSYKLYALVNSPEGTVFYRSTTHDESTSQETGGSFVTIDPKVAMPDIQYESDTDNIKELPLYGFKNDNENYFFEYNGEYYKFNPRTNLMGDKVTITNNTYNSKELETKEFVDKEGTYVFVLRDASATKGSNLAEENQYLSYPSAFEYVTVSADESRLTVGFKSKNTNNILSLMDSSVFSTEGSSKTTYFLPTNEEKIYVSVIPTKVIGSGENAKYIQVESVHVEYYEFETNFNKTLLDSFSVNNLDNLTMFNYYKTLASDPYLVEDLYLYSRDGANQNTLEFELNVNNNQTGEGLYIITRTYHVEEGNPKYMVSPYDYQTRTTNSIVDRYNTITKSETFNIEITKYTATFTSKQPGTSKVYTLDMYQTSDNILYISKDSTFFNTKQENMLNFIQITLEGETKAKLLSNLNLPSYKTYTDKNGKEYYVYTPDKKISKIEANHQDLYTAVLTDELVEATSSQSLVGGTMLVTTYSSYSSDPTKNGSIISLSYPGQTTKEMLLYGTGDSFYTSEDTSNILNLSYSFETNKLPVSISIPKYKFTEYFTKRLETDLANQKELVINSVYENAGLSYYGSEKDASRSITSYELEVEVSFYAGVGEDDGDLKLNDLSIPTEVYKSKGDVSNGYLSLYQYDNGKWGSLVNDFYKNGRYIVKITQASKEIESSNYNFKKSYSFAFDIKKSQPEFDVYGGKLLKSVEDLSFFDSTTTTSPLTYYTNKENISISWTDTTYIYKANIDKKNIVLNLNNSRLLYLTLSPEHQSVSVNDPTYNKFFKYTYNSSSLTNTLEFSLKDLGLNSNGLFIETTMKFEGHDATPYYQATTKRIVYDQTSSYETIGNLHGLINSNKYGLSLDDIREYYLADGFTKTTKEYASYNQTNTSNPIYNNYSFVVTKDFFEGLQNVLRENITNSARNNETTMAYYRVIDYPNNYNPTSNTIDFVEGDFMQIKNNTLFTDMENKYYEIVEKDLAGNLTIYIVYVSALDSKKVVAGEDVLQGLSYKHSADSDAINISDSELLTNKVEISGSTDMQLASMNYRGDVWQYFYVETYNTKLGIYTTTYYLMTPSADCYQITGSANKNYAETDLSSIFGNEANGYKKYLYILDKTTGLYNKVGIAQSETASITYTTGELGNTAYISIALPNENFLEDNLVRAYPVKISLNEGASNIYYCENNPQDSENLLNNDYSYIDAYMAESNDKVSVVYENGYIRLEIQNVINDTKFNIEIEDNFGNVVKDVYLVGETKVEPVTSNGNLYTYFGEVDNDVNFVYLSSKDFVFSYNTVKYLPKVYVFNGIDFVEANISAYDKENLSFSTYSRGTIASFIATPKQSQYDILVKVCLFDSDNPTSEPLMSYYLNLYNMLPTQKDDILNPNDYFISITNSNGTDDTDNLISIIANENNWQEVTIGGKVYKVCSSRQTFSDELRISYKNPSALPFPYEVLYYYETENWENGTDFVPLESGTRLNKNGIYYILVKYSSSEVLTNEYYVYKIEILGSTATNYFIYANGQSVNRASSYYTDLNNTQHSEYYIVNINHQDRNIKEKFEIMTNDYQQISSYEIPNGTLPYYKAEGSGIYTYKYLITNFTWTGGPNTKNDNKLNWASPTEEGIEAYFHVIFVTFLNPNKNFLLLSEENTSGISYRTDDSSLEYVKSSTSQIKVVVYDDTATTDSMTIYWNKSYGISWNTISMIVEKDGRKIDVEVNENEFNYYATLTRSGSYKLKFQDEAGNVQEFYSGMTTLPLIFIKDVHFTTSYVNPITSEEVETEAINKAVYNGEVKLKLNKLLIPYYQPSTFGVGNIIKVTRDGMEYTEYDYDTETYTFTFKQTGYYVVHMVAYDKEPPHTKIRTEKYTFTIINENESRYAYNFSGYKDYYVKQVIKDGIDVTDALLKSLKTATNTISAKDIIGGKVVEKQYLRNLLISFYDEKTGSGRYQITICANDKLYVNSSEDLTSFTFEFFINSKAVPIYVSVAEGASTNGSVTVTFNAKDVYDTVGECYVIVPGNEPFHVTRETVEEQNLTLPASANGEHSSYIQVTTMSGNVLYSYKVVLKEAMNAWTWIAIVGGAVVIAVVTFIVVKLRKKIGVK